MATEPWFIGMMIALALLIVILINVCVLVRERGGKYSVQEKEPFQNQIMSSESQGFDEYQKNQPEGGGRGVPVVTGPSQLYFDDRQFHDEDDSMAEYANGENGKFNEEGSFLGLYGKDRIQTYIVQYNQNQGAAAAAAAAAGAGATTSAGANIAAITSSADAAGKPPSTFV